ncbi:tripartite tricarboxylate transporter TctB family protein [Lutimaribacter marinistellae]|uniref:Tripartite tricarboxylate transporter TctB family protein n=1 Tax=Lutimaribacter marinistellae TaxID=1820329 RepID=A0ABV7TJG7_9RHOB
MRADRWSGLVCLLIGVALYVAIIPWQVETVGYGWLRPRTLPRALAVIIALCGLWLLLVPAEDIRPSSVPWLRVSLFAGLLGAGLWLISLFGFLWVAPGLALAIMTLSGERRPLWLVLGAAGMPLAIWWTVTVLLERPLPGPG